MNFKWLGPLALLAALVIGDQIRINRPGHKYRMTVEVETPEGVKSASSILAVTPDRGYSRKGQTSTSGDEVICGADLGELILALQIHPYLRTGAQRFAELDRRLRSDGLLAGDDLVEPAASRAIALTRVVRVADRIGRVVERKSACTSGIISRGSFDGCLL